MASTGTLVDQHPLVGLVHGLDHELDAVAEVRAWSLDAQATRELLARLSVTQARLAEVELRLAAHADTVEVGAVSGATSTGAWWACETRQTKPGAIGKVKLALALDGPRTLTRDALASGALLLEQARVIVRAVENLPENTDPAIVLKAEETLIDLAATHDARALGVLGDRILSVVAPEVGEEHDRQALERAARRAEQKRRLTMTRDGQGSVYLRATLPEAQAQMLTKMLHAIAAPKHQNAAHGAGSFEAGRPSAQRMGEAFCELIETLPTKRLPRIGRANASIVVTIDLEALLSGLGIATLDTGGVITAAEARRLACEATLIPAVLNGESRVLDWGRGKRFHDEHQRGAITVEQRHCTAQGCDWPAYLCHVHHDHPWSLGGHTNTDDARLLCPRHHARAHDPAYAASIGSDNKVTFTRINRRT